jgi:hypothetical protein
VSNHLLDPLRVVEVEHSLSLSHVVIERPLKEVFILKGELAFPLFGILSESAFKLDPIWFDFI